MNTTAKQSQLPFQLEESSVQISQGQPPEQQPEQSQRSSYHFGENSAAEPNGYRYQITNLSTEALDIDHLFNIIAGSGHFEKSDGSMLNVIQMIAEGFNESMALRTLVQERFDSMGSTLEQFS